MPKIRASIVSIAIITCIVTPSRAAWNSFSLSTNITNSRGVPVSTGAARNDGIPRLYAANMLSTQGIQEFTWNSASSSFTIVTVSTGPARSNLSVGAARHDGAQRIYSVVGVDNDPAILREYTWGGSSYTASGNISNLGTAYTSGFYSRVNQFQVLVASNTGAGRAAVYTANAGSNAKMMYIREHVWNSSLSAWDTTAIADNVNTNPSGIADGLGFTLDGVSPNSRVVIGDVRGDGKNRIYFIAPAGGNSTLYEYSYNTGSSQWDLATYSGASICPPSNSPGTCPGSNPVIGPGRNDSVNRIYAGEYEISWNGSAFTGKEIWEGRPGGKPAAFNPGAGPGRTQTAGVGPVGSDGAYRLYLLGQGDNQLYELIYTGGYYEPKAVYKTGYTRVDNLYGGAAGRFLIADVRNDGTRRVYHGWGTATPTGLSELADSTGPITVMLPASAGYTTPLAVDLSSSAEGAAEFLDQTFSQNADITLASTDTFAAASSFTATGIGFVVTSTIPSLTPTKPIAYSIFYPAAVASSYNSSRLKIAWYNPVSGSWELPAYNIVDVDASSMKVSGNFSALGKFQLMVATTTAIAKLIPTTGGAISVNGDVGNWTGSILFPNGSFGYAMAVTVALPASFPSSVSGYINGRLETVIPTGIGFSVEKSTPAAPAANLTLNAVYDAALMAPFNIRKLFLLRYNTVSQRWEACDTPENCNNGDPMGIDFANHTVRYKGRNTSVFQLMQAESENWGIGTGSGSSQSLYAYPSPFSLSKHGILRIANGKAGESIKIFSLGGYFIKAITVNANGIGLWDGKDESGTKVTQGTYFITAGRHNFTFMVLP